MTQPTDHVRCDVCLAYVRRRAHVLAPHLRALANTEHGGDIEAAIATFLGRVHARHMRGASIATPGGTTESAAEWLARTRELRRTLAVAFTALHTQEEIR